MREGWICELSGNVENGILRRWYKPIAAVHKANGIVLASYMSKASPIFELLVCNQPSNEIIGGNKKHVFTSAVEYSA